MIKKITLTLIFCCLVASCGKKGNPIYKDSENKARIQKTLTSKS